MTSPKHTCHYLSAGGACPACKEAFDASPAGIVTKAIEALDSEDQSLALCNLLQVLADEMSDENAVEREFPEHIPSARWQVCDFRYGKWLTTESWTAALAVARSILGQADPNASEAVGE